MLITITFEVDEKTAKFLCQSSIERVINTSVRLAKKSDPDHTVNQEDWIEWKPVVCALWGALKDQAFRRLNNIRPENRICVLRKGDL